MAVSLRPKFTKADITAVLERRRQALSDALLLRLRRIGEEFVRDARENGSYRDRTGNLRSSIGYVILNNGVQIDENFKRYPGEKGKKGDRAGVEAARKAIEEAKGNFPRGFVLICVAGMDYAAAVEARGYDVLTASSITAENSLRKAIAELGNKLGKR